MHRLVVSSFFVLFLSGCASLEPTACGQGPDLAVGDNWIYRHSFDEGPTGTLYTNVTAVDESVQMNVVSIQGGDRFTANSEVCAQGWSYLSSGSNEEDGSGYQVRFAEPCGGIRFPIVVGDEYEQSCTPIDDATTTEFNFRVEAMEPVEGPAGTFDAFRINKTMSESDWLVYEVGWYSEEVCNWVRIESHLASVDVRGLQELTAYQCSD